MLAHGRSDILVSKHWHFIWQLKHCRCEVMISHTVLLLLITWPRLWLLIGQFASRSWHLKQMSRDQVTSVGCLSLAGCSPSIDTLSRLAACPASYVIGQHWSNIELDSSCSSCCHDNGICCCVIQQTVSHWSLQHHRWTVHSWLWDQGKQQEMMRPTLRTLCVCEGCVAWSLIRKMVEEQQLTTITLQLSDALMYPKYSAAPTGKCTSSTWLLHNVHP